MKKILLFSLLAGMFFLSAVPFAHAHSNQWVTNVSVETNLLNTETGEKITLPKNGKPVNGTDQEEEGPLHFIVLYLGITLFVLITLNIILGFLRYKKILPWKMSAHKWIGIAIWLIALTHAIIAIFFS